jgi:CheY-like chemotaxis protein/HPt (histidine-containing phosphotransfer) domain-containing protein
LFPDSGLEGTRVLVVDDGEENRELFSYYLRVAGAEVTAAVDGREGVEKALNGEFDLVLMDIQMPNLDGYEALRFLRDRSYEVPVVALTAHAMKEAAERCVNAGFTAHLAKPIDARDLIAAVQRYRRGSAVLSSEQSAVLSCEFTERSTSGQDYLPVTVMAIINKFREQLPTKLSELVSAAERGEFDELSRLSHKLKGAAGACGFDELVRGIEHIEESLQNSLTPELIQSRCRSLKRTFLAGGRSNSTERSLFS